MMVDFSPVHPWKQGKLCMILNEQCYFLIHIFAHTLWWRNEYESKKKRFTNCLTTTASMMMMSLMYEWVCAFFFVLIWDGIHQSVRPNEIEKKKNQMWDTRPLLPLTHRHSICKIWFGLFMDFIRFLLPAHHRHQHHHNNHRHHHLLLSSLLFLLMFLLLSKNIIFG